MDHVFETRLPDPDDEPGKALDDLCGDSLESISEIVVLKRPAGSAPAGSRSEFVARRQPGPIGPDAYSDWRLVFDRQVTRWVGAMAFRREDPTRLARLSPALGDLSRRLDDLQPDWADVPFMRTVRMLLLLEALLVPEITFHAARGDAGALGRETDWRRWRRDLHAEAGSLREDCDDLHALIRNLRGVNVRLGETDWHVSVPLLLLPAVVYSQYEYSASPLWQAHSALRARDELRRKWGAALKRTAGRPRFAALEHGCRLVSLLVRYQSAVGKHVRQSGDARFLAAATAFAETTGGAFPRSVALDALRLLSILEEARLRNLPGTTPDTRIGPCRVNAGAIRPWESAEPAVRDWYLLERRDLSDGERQALALSGESNEPSESSGPAESSRSGRSAPPLIGRVFRSQTTLRETLQRHLASSDLPPEAGGELVDRLVRRARQTAAGSIARIAAACRTEADGPPDQAARTWTYASRLDVSDDDVRTFQRFVERRWASLVEAEGADPVSDVAAFSFGLTQARDLKGPLERCVAEVARAGRDAAGDRADEAGAEAFARHFRLSLTTIPCSWGPAGEAAGVEHVVEVRLRDERAAWGLLLPGDDEPAPATVDEGDADARSAADLLGRLFDRAAARLGATQRALCGERYVPFPLFERMLDVVARLRPAESLALAATFDGRRRLVRLPIGLDEARHGHLVRYIADFVHAVVLNRAMTEGFRCCDVSFDGLEAAGESQARAGARMTAARWKETIRDAYEQNCYETLADKYLRDYNTERRSVAMLDAARPTTLRKPSPEVVAAELARWIGARPKRITQATGPGPLESPEPLEEDVAQTQLLLGLDVGATLTKIRFYSVRAGRLGPVGGAYQIGTPRLSRGADRKPGDPAARFAAELVRGIEQIVRSDDALRRRLSGDGAAVLCVGVTWPGPVRDNHVAGTSRILASFPPLGRNVADNRIEAILDLDVAGAIRRALRRSPDLCRGSEPFVALLNDGDAAGYGTLVIDGRLPGRRLAVVKIGTGTATTVLDDGQLLPGPCEGGKVMLDLGAAPARKRPAGIEYPNGVANAYLSKRLLPAVAAKRVEEGKLPFCVDGVGSREIGLFLLADPRPLRDQCGVRDLAEESSIGVEVLRRVLERKEDAETELRRQVERFLDLVGAAAIDRLEQLVEQRGLVRLAERLGLPAETVRRYFDTIDEQPLDAIGDGSADAQTIEVRGRMAWFRREVAEPSVRALGEYLGDFLVLMATQYGVDAFVVAGGVLRERTGELVRQAAIGRAAFYGFRLRASGSLMEVVARPPWMADARPSDCSEAAEHRLPGQPNDRDPGYGTAGAAAFAAGEFLLRRKQEGLEEIRSKLLRLPTGQCATLADDRIRFDGGAADDVVLVHHALDAKEVRQFLARERIVVETAGPPGTTRYVRILAERSQAFEI